MLLVDELNLLHCLQDSDFQPATELANNLLLDLMLRPCKRMLVFSSHEVWATAKLAEFMAVNKSARGVKIRALPLVTK